MKNIAEQFTACVGIALIIVSVIVSISFKCAGVPRDKTRQPFDIAIVVMFIVGIILTIAFAGYLA